MTPDPFDAAALERLRTLDPDGSSGFMRQILTTFEASLVKHLALLGAVDTPAALASAAAIAHKLKSSSSSIGALTFASHCDEVEKAARKGDPSDFLPALHALRAEGERVLSALRTMLNG